MAQPNSFIQVNIPATAGKKLATYEFVDGGNVVESEAVTLTDSFGDEILGPKPAAESIPVTLATDQPPIEITMLPSTLHNGAETAVTGVEALILVANPNRAWFIIQNTGGANIRVGVLGVTATTGLRLTPNAVATYDQFGAFKGDLYAIREGANDSIAFAQEATTP